MRASRPFVYVLVLATAAATGLSNGAHASHLGPPISVGTVAQQSPDGTQDLDGDGRGDVIVGDDRPRITFRRGFDGHALWSLTPNGLINLVVLRLGAPVRPGVLAVSMRGPEGDKTLFLTAYQGGTGAPLWSWSGRGAKFDAFLPSAAGRAARVLVHYQAGPRGHAVAPAVIYGTDGSEHAADKTSFPAQRTALGDIDGDGYADFGLLGEALFQARSSTTGATLWTRLRATDDSAYKYVELPDVNSDGRADVLATNEHGDIVIDGANGTTMWTALNNHLQKFGDVDGDGLADLVGNTGFYLCGGRLKAYSGKTGAVLWEHAFNRFDYVCAYPAGDVHGDGVPDVAVDVGVSPGSTVLVNGRDGHLMWRVSRDDYYLRPLHQSVDGTGDDFVCLHFVENCGSATVFDGRTRQILFTFDAPSPDQRVSDVTAGQVTADDHADLLVVLTRTNEYAGTVAVVDGATHQVRWSWQR